MAKAISAPPKAGAKAQPKRPVSPSSGRHQRLQSHHATSAEPLPSLAVTPIHAQNAPKPDEIIAQENAFWKAYTTGNIGDLQKLLLPDLTNVEEEMWGRDKVLSFVKDFTAHCSLAPVETVDPHVTFLTPEIATIVYHAVESPTCSGRTMSGETNISTVWLRRDGRWQMHLHTEYAVPPK